MASAPDVVVIGGGAIGGSVALALTERGLAVSVVEAGRVGRGATWAAAGFLGPELNPADPPALVALSEASLKLWPDWVAEVQERSGVNLHYRRDGLLHVWVDPEAASLPAELGTEPPPTGSGQRLSASDVRSGEPALTGPVSGAIWHAEDAQVENARLGLALARAAISGGATYRTGTPVTGLMRSGARCTGVRLADGTELAAGAVVVAAGAWSGPLARSLGITLPVEPWRGQMLAFDALQMPIRHMVVCGELVLIPRAHGRLVVGTTFENAGFDCRVTLGGLAEILARAARVAPVLAELPLARTWAGLRPVSPDGLPYLGPVPGWDGLYAATGHGRKGILHAPLTGRLMTGLIADNFIDRLLEPCLPARAM